MSQLRESLYRLAAEWDQEATAGFVENPIPFTRMLDEVLFHADLRYCDFKQFPEDGDFAARLVKWLNNVTQPNQKKLLFQLLLRLVFIDRTQIRSLYRDAYRSVIAPWITPKAWTAKDFLKANFERRLRTLLQDTLILSLTQSFDFPEFLRTNSLAGIDKPIVLPEVPRSAKTLLASINSNPKRIIVLEDFVGSGSQARRILALVVNRFTDASILFVPLTILPEGFEALQKDVRLRRVHVDPVFRVSPQVCLKSTAIKGERQETKAIRRIVKALRSRVLKPLNRLDECPTDAFGYGSCGALVVSAHNTPNNTLPLIHHRAPSWEPLFRRVHHTYKSK